MIQILKTKPKNENRFSKPDFLKTKYEIEMQNDIESKKIKTKIGFQNPNPYKIVWNKKRKSIFGIRFENKKRNPKTKYEIF